jgi:hypothetical protein
MEKPLACENVVYYLTPTGYVPYIVTPEVYANFCLTQPKSNKVEEKAELSTSNVKASEIEQHGNYCEQEKLVDSRPLLPITEKKSDGQESASIPNSLSLENISNSAQNSNFDREFECEQVLKRINKLHRIQETSVSLESNSQYSKNCLPKRGGIMECQKGFDGASHAGLPEFLWGNLDPWNKRKDFRSSVSNYPYKKAPVSLHRESFSKLKTYKGEGNKIHPPLSDYIEAVPSLIYVFFSLFCLAYYFWPTCIPLILGGVGAVCLICKNSSKIRQSFSEICKIWELDLMDMKRDRTVNFRAVGETWNPPPFTHDSPKQKGEQMLGPDKSFVNKIETETDKINMSCNFLDNLWCEKHFVQKLSKKKAEGVDMFYVYGKDINPFRTDIPILGQMVSEYLDETLPLSYPSVPVVKNEKILWKVTKSKLDTAVSSSYTQLHRYLRRWHTKFKYNLLWVGSFLCSD